MLWKRSSRSIRSRLKQAGFGASQDAQQQHTHFQGLVQASDSHAKTTHAPSSCHTMAQAALGTNKH